MVSVSILSILATTSWRAPPTSRKCTIALDQQASLRHITQVRRDMNSTLQRASRFHRKPRPTLRQQRRCSVTGSASAPHFAPNVQFLGGKLPYLLSVPKRGDRPRSAFAVLNRCNSSVRSRLVFYT